ncbi:MAG: four helix bundle protein [Anaerolineaceae bacterium]|nr:four helix bundle protein [Anaerolineaceae bacterium]
MDLAVTICRDILPTLPDKEKYSLTNQLRRSAQSIPANIAEGYGRYYYQEGIRFCYIARGSIEETYTHLIMAHRLGYLVEDLFLSMAEEIDELRKMLNGYIAYLKRSKRGANEPGSSTNLREVPQEYEAEPTSKPNLTDNETFIPDQCQSSDF